VSGYVAEEKIAIAEVSVFAFTYSLIFLLDCFWSLLSVSM